MKSRKTLLFILLVLSSGFLSGQDIGHNNFPAQISLVYPIGTSGHKSSEITYNFSLNALSGITFGIKGCEIGGLTNFNKNDVKGIQAAGIGNITNGNVVGMQTGGLFSLSTGVNGLQVNGLFGKSNEVKGVQISGIINLSSSSNAMFGGIININKGYLKGIQVAGICNYTVDLDGIQIGLINIVDTVKKGISIGLISIVKHEPYNEWTISFADYMNAGISYKLGSRSLYNIYSAGKNFMEDQLWVAGLGFGYIKEISSKYSFQPEIICYTYFPDDFKRPIRDTYITHFKFGFARNLNEALAISFAPSFYWSLKSNKATENIYGYKQSSIEPVFEYDTKYSNSRFELGVGLSLGLNIIK